jgi:hypothetical protein
MRLFRKKSESQSGNQEYLDGLITSIRKARRNDDDKPDLQAFIEEEYYPGEKTMSGPRGPQGVSGSSGTIEDKQEGDDAEAVANLEAYLSALNAADAAEADEEAQD